MRARGSRCVAGRGGRSTERPYAGIVGAVRQASPLHETRREELLRAAAVVLTRVGFERMRLRDVAAEAGVSIGLLQHYFDTREQLGREAFAAVCGERAGRFARAADDTGPAWDRVVAMLGHAFDDPELEARSLTWLDLCAAAGRDPELRRQAALVQDAYQQEERSRGDSVIEHLVDRAIEAGLGEAEDSQDHEA